VEGNCWQHGGLFQGDGGDAPPMHASAILLSAGWILGLSSGVIREELSWRAIYGIMGDCCVQGTP
jgi:hypothetical protein